MTRRLLLSVLIVCIALPLSAQKKGDRIKSEVMPDMHKSNLMFNLHEMGFGAQGIGMIACQYLTVTNNTIEDISLTEIVVPGSTVFTVPTPSKSMMPVTIPAKRTMTISVCFTPDKAGEFKGRIRFKTSDNDTVSIPVWGTGVKREDLDKLPKTDITTSLTKKGEAKITLRLTAQSKVILQVYDALGLLVATYFNNEVVNPGTYDHLFTKTSRGSAPEPGTYYARLIYNEVNVGREVKLSKMFTVK